MPRPPASWLPPVVKIKPIGRHAMDEKIEKEAFALQPGQVSTLIKTPQGILMLKCDRRLPADTTVNFESVKEKLEKEFREQKLQGEMAKSFQALRDQAKPQLVLQKADRLPAGPVPSPTSAVAYLYGSKPVTREELGEFLIARMGADKLEFLVNRRIIDLECAERKVAVSDAEVDRALEDDLKMLNCDRKHFEKEVLSKWGKSLFEYREDVVRPRLMLTRLCQGRVKVTDEDVQKGFEAYYGERLECRLILWPTEQARFALTEYAKIRDSEEEFDRKAKSQASASLAAQGGKIPLFGRHTLGDETLEREAFRLQPGEISTLIGTAQGQVVIRCDRRIPPDKGVKLEQVRDKLAAEVRERKVQMEMQTVFRELKEKAAPRLILQGTNQVEDLAAESKRLLSEAQVIQGRLPSK
ncbi:MAG: peptidyl-prolyl cis-trans isomerase [Gemmataceae bacterium]